MSDSESLLPQPRSTAATVPPESKDPKEKFIKDCRQKGRWVNVAISFAVDLHYVFKFGIQADMRELAAENDDDDDGADDGDDDDDGDDSDGDNGDNDGLRYCNTSAVERETLVNAYHAVLKFIPELKDMLPYKAGADPAYFYKVVDAIQEGCNSSRSEVVKRVKDNTIRYLTAGPVPVEVNSQVQHKELRGFNDRGTGRLIIPADALEEWDEDPDAARAGYMSGIFSIYGSEMPVFLYEDYKYNPSDPEEGLFRGPFLVCTLIDILFGPNAVDVKKVKRDEQPRNHSTGEMYRIQTISAENIAFAAVVARFCLSSKRSWHVYDDNFNHRMFYQSILFRLADREDPWVQETLAWWNERVFGNQRGKALAGDSNDREREEWLRFVRRQAGRKAALTASRVRIQALGSASIQDASQGDLDPSITHSNTPHGQDVPLTMTTPPSRPSPVIDPSLLDTPHLELDSSMLTQPSPSVPRTPDGPGSGSLQHDSSPLSNVSDGDTNAEVSKEVQRLKRKKPISKAVRPRAKVMRKSARA